MRREGTLSHWTGDARHLESRGGPYRGAQLGKSKEQQGMEQGCTRGHRTSLCATPTHNPATLTTPSGSTSSRCLGCPLCKPVSTYWPGVVVLSRTRKSPLSCSRASASRRLSFPWNQGSPRSCSAMAIDWGGGGTRRASSKGSGGAEGGLGEAAGTTHAQDPEPSGRKDQEGKSRRKVGR